MKTTALAAAVTSSLTTFAAAQTLYFEDFEAITRDFIDADSFNAFGDATRSGTAIFSASETLTGSSGIIDGSAIPGAQVDFSWAAVGVTGDNDFLDVSVDGTSVFLFTGSELRPGADGFRSPAPIDISAFTAGDFEVVWTLSSSSFSSLILLDDLSVVVIPAPSVLAIYGAGLTVAGRRRR